VVVNFCLVEWGIERGEEERREKRREKRRGKRREKRTEKRREERREETNTDWRLLINNLLFASENSPLFPISLFLSLSSSPVFTPSSHRIAHLFTLLASQQRCGRPKSSLSLIPPISIGSVCWPRLLWSHETRDLGVFLVIFSTGHHIVEYFVYTDGNYGVGTGRGIASISPMRPSISR